MTLQDSIDIYVGMSQEQQTRFLVKLSYELTVFMRDQQGTDVTLHNLRLIGVNELQHHLSSQINHHLSNDLKRYPEDVFLHILTQKAAYYEIASELQASLVRALTE